MVSPYVLFVLTLPHIFYWFVWTQPKRFMAICRQVGNVDPVYGMSRFSFVLRAIQIVVMAGVILPNAASDLLSVRAWQFLLACVLGAAGQYLNYHVYHTLGMDGVYYGFKLGKTVPWVHDWIFDNVHHPQYTGTVMTLLCLAVLFPHFNVFVYVTFWSLCYVFTTMVENGATLDMFRSSKSKKRSR